MTTFNRIVLTLGIQWAVAATFFPLMTLIALHFFRGKSAQFRHHLWEFALLATLLFPAVCPLLPQTTHFNPSDFLPAAWFHAPEPEFVTIPVAPGAAEKIEPSASLLAVSTDDEAAENTVSSAVPSDDFGAFSGWDLGRGGFDAPPSLNGRSWGESGAAAGITGLPAASGEDSSPVGTSAQAGVPEPQFQTILVPPPFYRTVLPVVLGSLAGLWILGAAIHLIFLAVSIIRARRLCRRSVPLAETPSDWSRLFERLASTIGPTAQRTRLRISDEVTVPMVVGFFRPTILLPRIGDAWSQEQRRGILLHELAHGRRRDPLWLLAARLTGAILWYHPLARYITAQMRVEREFACDDAVLLAGEYSDVYASTLLEIALEASETGGLPAIGVAMVRKGNRIVERIDSVLDAKKNRCPISRLGLILAGILTAAMIFAAAQITPTLRGKQADESAETAETAETAVEEKVETADENAKPSAEENAAEKSAEKTDENIAEAKASKRFPEKMTVHVRDQAGKPILGAGGFHRFVNCTDFTVDENGDFTIAMPKNKEEEERSCPDFTVSKDGYGPFIAHFNSVAVIPDEFTVVLNPAQKIGGIVVDENGRPVEGVQISFNIGCDTVYRVESPPYVHPVTVTTDTQGRWTMNQLPASCLELCSIIVKKEGFTGFERKPSLAQLQADADGAFSCKMELSRGYSVEGRVVDVNGGPISGATLKQLDCEAPPITTDAQGKFKFEHLWLGDERLMKVTAPEKAAMLVPLVVRSENEPMTIVMKPGRTLTFRVLDSSGKPLENAVFCSLGYDGAECPFFGFFPDKSAKTDADGVWVWREAPTVPFQFCADKEGYSRIVTDVSVDQDEVTVTLYRNTVTLVVTDAVTNEPIPAFRFLPRYFTHLDNDSFSSWPMAPSIGENGKAIEGIFSSHHESDSAVRFDVLADGYKLGFSRRVPITEENAVVEVKLEKGKSDFIPDIFTPDEAPQNQNDSGQTADVGPTLSGVVLTSDGKPAAGAALSIAANKQSGGATPSAATADAQGRWTLSLIACSEGLCEPIDTGRFTIFVEHPSGMALIDGGDYWKKSNGGKNAETIKLKPWGKIEGTVNVAGKPLEGVSLSFDLEKPENLPFIPFIFRNVTTGRNGHFQVDRIPFGTVKITRYENSFPRSNRYWSIYVGKVAVQSGETSAFVPGREGKTVTGRIAFPSDSHFNPHKYAVRIVPTPEDPNDLPPRSLPKEMKFQRDRENRRMYQQRLDAWYKTDAGRAYKEWRDRYDRLAANCRITVVQSDGTFCFDNLPAGKWSLVVSDHDFCGMNFAPEKPHYRGDFTMNDQPLDIGTLTLVTEPPKAEEAETESAETAAQPSDNSAEPSALVVEEPFLVRGVVVDEQKKPVAGAKLYLNDINLDESKRAATADDKGEFSYSVNELSRWPEVWAVSPDGEKAGSSVIRRQEGETDYSPTTVVIHQARRITGRVLDAEGKPVAGALVAGCDQTTVPLYVTSGEDGIFSFPYPKTRLDESPLSLLQVFAWKEGVGFDYAVTKEIDSGSGVTPPEDISDGPFELTLQPFGKTKFRVTDEKNQPISGAEVTPWLIVKPDAGGSFNTVSDLSFFKAFTDADGIALCESVPDAWKEKTTYYFYGPPMKRSAEQVGKTEGYCGNYFENSCDKSLKKLTADADGVYSVQLPRQAVTRVRVTLPDGTPVPGAAISRTFHKMGGHGLWKTDSLGEVLLKENAGQFLDIAAESRLGAAPGVFAWDCGDGSEEKTLNIVLEKGIRLHGRVARADGSVPNIFYVIISEQDPNPESDADKDYCDREGCGTDTARCARQTEGGVGSLVMKSNKGLQADEYEYLLPAVKRTYKIAAVTEPDERILCIKELTVNGDEKEITLDMVLEPKKEEKPAENQPAEKANAEASNAAAVENQPSNAAAIQAALAGVAERNKFRSRVLFVDGGHDYDRPSMEKLLESLSEIATIDRASLPEDRALFTPELAEKYDCLILYDQDQQPMADAEKANFMALLDSGIGVIALHHHIGAHSDWPDFWKTMGGYYVREENKTATGREVPVSSYTDDVPMRIHVANPGHTIMNGISDFDIVDEAYANVYVDEKATVLLTTDEPKATRQVAWLWDCGRSPVLTLLLGHGPSVFENENYRRILKRGIYVLYEDVLKRRISAKLPKIDWKLTDWEKTTLGLDPDATPMAMYERLDAVNRNRDVPKGETSAEFFPRRLETIIRIDDLMLAEPLPDNFEHFVLCQKGGALLNSLFNGFDSQKNGVERWARLKDYLAELDRRAAAKGIASSPIDDFLPNRYNVLRGMAFFKEIQPFVVEYGRPILASLDAVLADQPLGETYEPFYSERMELLDILASCDPRYATELKKRSGECHKLAQTRESEIKTHSFDSYIDAVGRPEEPIDTPEKKAEMDDYLDRFEARLKSLPENRAENRIVSYVYQLRSLAEKDPSYQERLRRYAEDNGAPSPNGAQSTAPRNERVLNYCYDALLLLECQKFSKQGGTDEELRQLFDDVRSLLSLHQVFYLGNIVDYLFWNDISAHLAPGQRALLLEGLQDILARLRERQTRLGEEEDLSSSIKSLEKIFGTLTLVGKSISLEGTTADGKEFRWSDYAGKVVLIDFWGTQCGPCLKEFPSLKEQYAKYHDAGLEIVGVCYGGGEENTRLMNEIIARFELPWPTLDDARREIAGEPTMSELWAGIGIPYPILVGRDGKVIAAGDEVRQEGLAEKLKEIFESANQPAEAETQSAPEATPTASPNVATTPASSSGPSASAPTPPNASSPNEVKVSLLSTPENPTLEERVLQFPFGNVVPELHGIKSLVLSSNAWAPRELSEADWQAVRSIQ